MYNIAGKGEGGREITTPPFSWKIRLEAVHIFATMHWNYFSNQSHTVQWCLSFQYCSSLLFLCTISLECLQTVRWVGSSLRLSRKLQEQRKNKPPPYWLDRLYFSQVKFNCLTTFCHTQENIDILLTQKSTRVTVFCLENIPQHELARFLL